MMDKDYYTKQREERLKRRDLIVDGDRKTVGGRPYCQVTLKELEDNQMYLDFGLSN